MSIEAEKVRQAKKFLENHKISIKLVKPKLFAIAANGLKKDFVSTLDFFMKGVDGGTSNKSD